MCNAGRTTLARSGMCVMLESDEDTYRRRTVVFKMRNGLERFDRDLHRDLIDEMWKMRRTPLRPYFLCWFLREGAESGDSKSQKRTIHRKFDGRTALSDAHANESQGRNHRPCSPLPQETEGTRIQSSRSDRKKAREDSRNENSNRFIGANFSYTDSPCWHGCEGTRGNSEECVFDRRSKSDLRRENYFGRRCVHLWSNFFELRTSAERRGSIVR